MAILVYFGTTRGLETLQLPIGSVSPQDIDLPDAWFEISNSFGRLSSESPLFLFFRRTVRGIQCSWIGLYMSVNEIGYQRSGGFYGAGLWFSGAPVNGQEALSCLSRAAETLKEGAIKQDGFQKTIAEIGPVLGPTVDLFRSLFNETSLTTGGCLPAERGSLAFIGAEGAGVVEVFEWAQRSSSAASYSKVIFGSPAQRPEGGRITQDRIFRSLALAIEFAHRARLTDFADQIECLEMQARQTEDSNRKLLEQCRSLGLRNRELENTNLDLEQRLQGLHQPQFRNPANLPARTPVNLVRGEPRNGTSAGAAESITRPVRSQQGYDSPRVSESLERHSSVNQSGGSGTFIFVFFIVPLVLVVLVLLLLLYYLPFS